MSDLPQQARAELASARSDLHLSNPAYLSKGASNWVYLCQGPEDQLLAVKIRPDGRSRFAAAAWAAELVASHGIPAPKVRWYGDYVCVEELARGLCASDLAPPQPQAAGHIAKALHELHDLPADGFGRLNETGLGEFQLVHQWLLRPAPASAALPGSVNWSQVMAKIREQLLAHAPLFDQVEPKLLHGDLRARHLFVHPDTGELIGIIDWESFRGGDPLTDLAGWTMQEPGWLGALLADRYLAGQELDDKALNRLTCYRLRIAPRLVTWHFGQGNTPLAALHLRQIESDLRNLRAGTPTLLPDPCP